MRRRRFLAASLVPLAASRAAVVRAEPDAVDYAVPVPGTPIRLPRDHGSHPDFRIEWWYITGWLRGRDEIERGFQVTFFRNRTGIGEASRSEFAPRQLVFAHAALADPRRGRLAHDQRAARAGFGLAGAFDGAPRVHIGDWSLALDGERWLARIPGRELSLDLSLSPTQPVLLQGEAGFSRKGPDPSQSSHYYSQPHLAVAGRVGVAGEAQEGVGEAWFDHEWSSELMDPRAAGWDWTGINLADGGALMAFRMRRQDGGVLWAAATRRHAGGRVETFAPNEIAFEPGRLWRSPRTGVDYPVTWRVRAGPEAFEIDPLMDDQELDARASTGTLYWEGAVLARRGGATAGRGYLELTGYAGPLRL